MMPALGYLFVCVCTDSVSGGCELRLRSFGCEAKISLFKLIVLLAERLSVFELKKNFKLLERDLYSKLANSWPAAG